MKKAIVVGASSGIGRALTKNLARDVYAVGIAARRHPLLVELQKEIGDRTFIKQMDVSKPQEAIFQFSELIREMGDADLIVISAGTGFINPDLDWDKESETIAVNVSGFAALANVAMHHFEQRGTGHLVNISSLAAIRGNGRAPAYNASKAFESNYMDGLRQRIARLRLPITLTDIQAGFVDTAMAKGEGLFWIAPLEKAAKQIYQAIKAKKKRAYVTKRWRLIAWFFKLVPDSIYYRL